MTIVDVAGRKQDFWMTTFRENAVGNRLQQVYYAWNVNQQWVAPKQARMAFAGEPMLYKLQVATRDVSNNECDAGAALQFLRDALPAISAVCK